MNGDVGLSNDNGVGLLFLMQFVVLSVFWCSVHIIYTCTHIMLS